MLIYCYARTYTKQTGEKVTSHTAIYCPPEVAKAHINNTNVFASSSMDVWAFGVVSPYREIVENCF